jgi:hypothetical protein
MRSIRTLRLVAALVLAPLALGGAACQSSGPGQPGGGGDDGDDDTTQPPPGTPDAAPPPSQWEQLLGSRTVNYHAALRIAALRLVGRLPTLDEMDKITEATDKKVAYETLIDGYMADPAFTTQVRNFFRDTFKMGGAGLDTAPTFAAQLVVEGKPFTNLFTAKTGNCPTLNGTTFTAADCASGAPAQAGVLTDPAVMKQFNSNMAFRRVKWVQETFDCTKYPAEFGTPQDVGGAAKYTAPWAFESVPSKTSGGTIDFRDVSAVVCANCHTTMNHQAPLFAHFDDQGRWQTNLVSRTPLDGNPVVKQSDYLSPGETTAWRQGAPAADLPAFGAAMAADPDVATCMVARVWNWGLGKGDIVATLAMVPPSVIEGQVMLFQSSSYDLKQVIRSVFTADDFVKF